MHARLLACPSCARHIRVDEERCPFCRVALPDDFGAGPAPVPPARHMSREGLYRYGRSGAALVATAALATSAATTLGACAVAAAYGTFVGFDGGELVDAKLDAPVDATSETAGDAADAEQDAESEAGPDVSAPSDAGDGG